MTNATSLRDAAAKAREVIAKRTKSVVESETVGDAPVELITVEDTMRFLKGDAS